MQRFVRSMLILCATVVIANVHSGARGQTAACCLADGSCRLVDQTNCLLLHGLFDRGGRTCDQVVCTGACCTSNGQCFDTSVDQCQSASGEFRGIGVTCDTQTCGGACCTADGGCRVSSQSTCVAPEIFNGLGTSCADVNCTGACCAADGACRLSSPSLCVAPEIFSGLGTSCADVDCSGACCGPDGTCLDTGQGNCEQLGGVFLGVDALCSDVECAGACCLPDKGCIETGAGFCAEAGGSYQGGGSVCGDDCPTAMPTAFIYQGQLQRNGAPLSGLIDARFSLWLSPTGDDPANQIGQAVDVNALEVDQGLFNVELDFGQDAFNGNARWLQVAMRDHTDNPDVPLVTLSPRQSLTPCPYSLQTRGIVVLGNGNVGIGTKTPEAKLHVANGDILAGPPGAEWIIHTRSQANGDFLQITDSTDGVPQFQHGLVVRKDGNVGVGTTAPDAGLHVKKEPVSAGGSLALEGLTQAFMSFFPNGAAAGRKGWFGYGSAGTTDLTLENDAGGAVVINNVVDMGIELVFSPFNADNFSASVGCPGDKRAIAGGCICTSVIKRSYPVGPGWACACEDVPNVADSGVQAYAICARVIVH